MTGIDTNGDTQADTQANIEAQMMDRLAETVWTQLAETAPRQLHIDDVAAAAGVSPAAARAVSGSITALILHRLAAFDRQAVLESLADIEDAGEVTIREKIVEALMRRFEVYAPFRQQIAQLDRAARRDPALGLRLLDSLAQAMRMMLHMVGDDGAGLAGEARVRGVALVAMQVARVWKTDDSADLSTTLKEIDARLTRAEEWGRTLRVLWDSNTDAAMHDTSPEGDADAGNAGPSGPGNRWQ